MTVCVVKYSHLPALAVFVLCSPLSLYFLNARSSLFCFLYMLCPHTTLPLYGLCIIQQQNAMARISLCFCCSGGCSLSLSLCLSLSPPSRYRLSLSSPTVSVVLLSRLLVSCGCVHMPRLLISLLLCPRISACHSVSLSLCLSLSLSLFISTPHVVVRYRGLSRGGAFFGPTNKNQPSRSLSLSLVGGCLFFSLLSWLDVHYRMDLIPSQSLCYTPVIHGLSLSSHTHSIRRDCGGWFFVRDPLLSLSLSLSLSLFTPRRLSLE